MFIRVTPSTAPSPRSLPQPRKPAPIIFAARLTLACLCLLPLLLSSCGYRVAGRSSILPESVRTIAVLPLENKTARYRIEQRLTEALVREWITRTKLRVTPEPAGADAVLSGEVTSIDTAAVLFDSATGRATTVVVTVTLKVRLTEQPSGRILYQNPNYLFREQYEISTDIPSFFDEGEPALGRLAREFAAALVSAILEGF